MDFKHAFKFQKVPDAKEKSGFAWKCAPKFHVGRMSQ